MLILCSECLSPTSVTSYVGTTKVTTLPLSTLQPTFLFRKIESVCVCVCIPLSLLDNGYVFYAVRVV
jgi:hypothetical protein